MRYTNLFNGLKLVDITEDKVIFKDNLGFKIDCILSKRNLSVYASLQGNKDYYLYHKDTILFTIITNFTNKGYELDSYHEYDYSNWR